MRTTFTQKFNEQQKVEKQLSKKWGYNVKESLLGSSRISITLTSQKSKSKYKQQEQKQICINSKIVPRQIEDIKPVISQKYKDLLKQMAQIQYEKKIRKHSQQKNNDLNIIKMLNERIDEYNYLIDHKHIINKNSEQTKKVLKLQPKSEAEKILQQINRENNELIHVEDIEQQFQINKTITALYRKYKDKMYEANKQISNHNNQRQLQDKNVDSINYGSTIKSESLAMKKNRMEADKVIEEILANNEQFLKCKNIQNITHLYRTIRYKLYQDSANSQHYYRRKPKSQAERIADEDKKMKKMREPLKIQDMQAIMVLYSKLNELNTNINSSRISKLMNSYQNTIVQTNIEKKSRNQSEHMRKQKNSQLSKERQENKKRVKSSAKVQQSLLYHTLNQQRVEQNGRQNQLQNLSEMGITKKKYNSLYEKVRIRNTKTSNTYSGSILNEKSQDDNQKKSNQKQSMIKMKKGNKFQLNEEQELNIEQPYLNEDQIEMLKQLKVTNIKNKEIIEKYKNKINRNMDLTLRKSKSRSKTKRILELMKQDRVLGLADEDLALMRQKKQCQQKYFSSYLEKRNRKYKKPWGNKILIKYDSTGQAKQMLAGAAATINANKTHQNFSNSRMETEKNQKKGESPKTTSFQFNAKAMNESTNKIGSILNKKTEEDALMEQSIMQLKNDKDHYSKMCKNEKVNLYLKSKKRNSKQ